MATAKCVELVASYSDGTTERATGEDLGVEVGSDRIVRVIDASSGGGYVSVDVSKPLRRTIEYVGTYTSAESAHLPESEIRDVVAKTRICLRHLLPDECAPLDPAATKRYRYRIVVEAVEEPS